MASRLFSFFSELKRRKVYRAAVVYIVVGLGILGAAEVILDPLGLGGLRGAIVILVLLGFPMALVLAWAVELTPDGIRRTQGPTSVDAHGPEPEDAVSDSTGGEGESPDATSYGATSGIEPPRKADPSVAVLPFSNLSPDPQHAYFADGMTEDVLAHLSKVKALKVKSRTSVMRYRDTTRTVSEIANELGVGAVLEGSVRATADRVRVVAQLIDAPTDTHLWAETYDRALEDIFAVQSEVAESVARALAAELSGEELEEIHEPPTANVEAYGLSLEAEVASRADDPDGYARALGLLEAAVRIDPRYARAQAGLASLLTSYPYVTSRLPSDYHHRLEDAVDRALELDPTSGHAWVARGYYLWSVERDWLGAEAALARALELEPNDSFVLERVALHAYLLGRFEETESLIQQMEEQDALTPRAEVWRGNVLLLKAAFGDLDFEPALRFFDDLITREPHLALARQSRGWTLSLAGRLEEGLEAVEASLRLAPEMPSARGLRGALLARLGRTEEARAEDARFREAAAAGTADPYCQSFLHFALGEIEGGFDLAEEAAAGRTSRMLPLVRLVPEYRPLWEHPRFLALMDAIWPGEQKQVLGEYGWRPGS